jgi:hypothetical protein
MVMKIVSGKALLMVTCMETWILTDRETIQSHYGPRLQKSALCELNDMEERSRDSIQDHLARATRNCQNRYAKGTRSFEIIGKLSPEVLKIHLGSFRRFLRILSDRL